MPKVECTNIDCIHNLNCESCQLNKIKIGLDNCCQDFEQR